MRAVPDPPDIWTDFSRYPHEELIRALSVSNPNEVVAAGDAWAAVAAALHERAQDISDRSGTLAAGWTGGAADRYRVMLSEMLNGVGRVAAAALEARDLMYAAGEALHTAWTSMPAVSGEAARRQAILIMAELAERYLAVTAELNESMSQLLPGAADPAQVGPSGVSSGPLPPGELVFGNPAGTAPAAGAPQPLFGGMLPAGLAAASAVLGRPFIPSLLAPRRADRPPAGGAETPGPAGVVPPDTAAAAPGIGGAGPDGAGPDGAGPDGGGLDPSAVGGGAGLGGIGGGGLPSLPHGGELAAVHPGVHATGLEQAGGVAAATGGGAAAGSGGMRGMPMMPMGMGGGEGGGGGGRRIPPWLVETEDVWGEPAVVTSSVIGEDGAGRVWW
jgi:hypothetical protein